jgi:uncharacterized membrane protein
MPLLRVRFCENADADVSDDALRRHVRLLPERTSTQDVGFGFRQLVDIAERALSPAVNDPTTAVLCIDQLHDLLRRLVDRPAPSGLHEDLAGVVRVIVPQRDWADHVALALDELRLWGRDSLQVRRRLSAMVDDLLDAAPAGRRQPLLERVPLWTTALPIDVRTNGDGNGRDALDAPRAGAHA